MIRCRFLVNRLGHHASTPGRVEMMFSPALGPVQNRPQASTSLRRSPNRSHAGKPLPPCVLDHMGERLHLRSSSSAGPPSTGRRIASVIKGRYDRQCSAVAPSTSPEGAAVRMASPRASTAVECRARKAARSVHRGWRCSWPRSSAAGRRHRLSPDQLLPKIFPKGPGRAEFRT
jgi:hypothetical protein